VTYNSDVCICFSGVLQEVESSFEFTDLIELEEADVSFLNEPQEETMARDRKRPYSELVSTGKSFWLFWESILPCRKTCFFIPA
jgi:hypothetical protein